MEEKKGNMHEGANDLPVERRRYPRLAASVDIEYTVLRKGGFQEKNTVIKNVSAGGICLIVYEKIEIGSLLALKLHLGDVHYDIMAKGTVIWRSPFTVGADGRECYDLGIEFTEINESDRQKISEYVFRLLR